MDLLADRNLIEDLKQVEFLSLCSNLETLTLYGNPICVKLNPDARDNDRSYNYRYEVIKILSHIKTLDDELTLNTKSIMANLRAQETNSAGARSKIVSHDDQCPFDDDWQLINDIIDEGIGPPEEKLAINGETGGTLEVQSWVSFALSFLFLPLQNVSGPTHHRAEEPGRVPVSGLFPPCVHSRHTAIRTRQFGPNPEPEPQPTAATATPNPSIFFQTTLTPSAT